MACMIYIVSGTNRIGSNTLKVAELIEAEYKKRSQKVSIVDLKELPFDTLHTANYGKNIPPKFADAIERLNKSSGVHFVVPEYNGSYPGILKYFIDHFSYPTTFEYRPIAFTGLGGRWGGLRPVEHLQGVFGYRNAFMFPQRVFISDVWNILKDNQIKDENINNLLKSQIDGFVKFIAGLESQGLDANSVNKLKSIGNA